MDAIQILNSIISGSEYASRIPLATRQNISSVGNTILSYSPSTNMFISSLIGRIGKVLVKSIDDMDDIYSFVSKDTMDYGDTLQKIFVDIASASNFDGTATTSLLSQNKTGIHVEYTKLDRRLQYKSSVSYEQLKEAFTTADKLTEFVIALIQSMAKGLSYDLYVMVTFAIYEHCKYELSLTNPVQLEVPASICYYDTTLEKLVWSNTGAKNFLKLIRVCSRALKFPHSLAYKNDDSTISGTISKVRTPISKQIVGLEVSSLAEIDVDALAVLFNMEKAEMNTRIVEMEDGALGLNNIDSTGATSGSATAYFMGFIADARSVEQYKTFESTDEFRNPESLTINHYLNWWGFVAVSKFADFVPIKCGLVPPTE